MRVWTAVNRNKMELIATVIAPGAKSAAIKLFDKVKYHKVDHYCTDGNYAYHEILPKEKHVISKSETCLVESFNARLRHYIASLRRRTMCYPKSRENLAMNVFMWMNKEKWAKSYL